MEVTTFIDHQLGIFRGFSESGLEFRADIITPYESGDTPVIGSFLLVGAGPDRVVLGRITKFHPTGAMAGLDGDEYLSTMSRLGRQVPEQLKLSKLRYNVNVKLLGSLSNGDGNFHFTPSIRRLPHLGAEVGTPTEQVMEYVCGIGLEDNEEPVKIGHLALGDAVFDGIDSKPVLPIRFDIERLIARRTYVFARAGYGKSNLVKLLISQLYEQTQPGGMLIFDPEGEYAFPDQLGRPGLASVPHLADKLVVFTDRAVAPEHAPWVQGKVRFDLASLRPSQVVSLTIPAEKQEMVFANRLRGVRGNNWNELIELLNRDHYDANDQELGRLLHMKPGKDDASINAVKSNLVPVVQSLHDPTSDLREAALDHLRRGRIVVVDISLLSSGKGEQVAGMLLSEVFKHNQRNFTAGSEQAMVPTIAVIEEAQSVLNPKSSDTSPFVEWAKEGRKYQLGSILITQQPSAIDARLLSQGDNFFAFHLVSEGDLRALQHVNAHFSNDVLSQLLNEPIRGNAYYWSAPHQPFVLSARIDSFDGYVEDRPVGTDRVETPASLFGEEHETKQHAFREAVVRALDSVKVYKPVGPSGPIGAAAINEWNLRFKVAEECPLDLVDAYCQAMSNGQPAARLEPVMDVIRCLGERVEQVRSTEDKPFILVHKEIAGREATGEVRLAEDLDR
jgi:hypothetical protein